MSRDARRPADSRADRLRRVATVFQGGYFTALLLSFGVRLLGVDGTWRSAIVGLGLVVGLAGGAYVARRLQPLPAGFQGPGLASLIGPAVLLAVVLCLFLPSPWRIVAPLVLVVVALATVVWARRQQRTPDAPPD